MFYNSKIRTYKFLLHERRFIELIRQLIPRPLGAVKLLISGIKCPMLASSKYKQFIGCKVVSVEVYFIIYKLVRRDFDLIISFETH